MERKVPFKEGEIYHLYTRGVEKRIVFLEKADHDRFVSNLFLCNSDANIHIGNVMAKYRGESSMNARFFDEIDRGTCLADILAYALMPNHVHLVVREKKKGGISKFMLKLMTAYSMYFNTKHERSGPLFTRPFRSKHIDSDEYFRWVFAYVLLNPLEMHQRNWRKEGFADQTKAAAYLQSYPYSSYADYFMNERPESRILEKAALPIEMHDMKTMDDLLIALSEASSEAEMFPE